MTACARSSPKQSAPDGKRTSIEHQHPVRACFDRIGRRAPRQKILKAAREARADRYHLIAFALRAERLKRSGEHGMHVLG